jgi:hypothetical protein
MTADLHQTKVAAVAEPPFHAELEEVWGRAWGAHDEVGTLRTVLVRPPGRALDRIRAGAWDPESEALVDPDGGWYWTDRRPPDRERVAAQHAGLVAALVDEGVEVISAASMGDGYTKGMYVRDPLITLNRSRAASSAIAAVPCSMHSVCRNPVVREKISARNVITARP